MFRHTPSTTSDPPLRAASHVPVTGALVEMIQAGLWKQSTGRPSGLSSTPPAAGAECGSMVGLPREIRRPHH